MTQNTAQIVSDMLEAHYSKSLDGYYGARPCEHAVQIMKGGLIQDYLNETGTQGLVREFDSALTWATPVNPADRLLVLSCAANATILPDDEPDCLSWRGVKSRPAELAHKVQLARGVGTGFGFSLVTIEGGVYVRRLQPDSPAARSGKLQEGDRLLSVCGTPVGTGLTQKEIIQMLKRESEVQLSVAHVTFDGKGCPETTLDRSSPLLSPALENSYRFALDLSHNSSLGSTSAFSAHSASTCSASAHSAISSGSGEERRSNFYRQTGMSSTGYDTMIRGNVRADEQTNAQTNTLPTSRQPLLHRVSGSVGESISTTTSSSRAALTRSSSESSEPVRTSSLASPLLTSPLPASPSLHSRRLGSCSGSFDNRAAVERGSPGRVVGYSTRNDRNSVASSRSSQSTVNKDYYRDSTDSLPKASCMGSTEYIVLPNQGKGIGIGISGKCGVVVRNILAGSLADKDGRLQIGDHILQVNDMKCHNMNQRETKEAVIPELRNSTPTVRLLVQHAVRRARTASSGASSNSSSCRSKIPSKSGSGATLPSQRNSEQTADLLLPEALWSDEHPTAPIAYRFGTVILPAPAWISWSVHKHTVTLTRLPNGYGFSIMDYKEPKQENGDGNSVLIIRQITPFGAADLEGSLQLGERIVAVNGDPISCQTIEDIVGMIKPCSILQLKMAKPVESDDWRRLLKTNISAIPLVSGPRSSSQEAISTSTLNVARAASYQPLPRTTPDLQHYPHPPIIRQPGDNLRSSPRERGSTVNTGPTGHVNGGGKSGSLREHSPIQRAQGSYDSTHSDEFKSTFSSRWCSSKVEDFSRSEGVRRRYQTGIHTSPHYMRSNSANSALTREEYPAREEYPTRDGQAARYGDIHPARDGQAARYGDIHRGPQTYSTYAKDGPQRQPIVNQRLPTPPSVSRAGLRSPELRRSRFTGSRGAANETYDSHQAYQPASGDCVPGLSPANYSRDSNAEVQSIVSSISGLNNPEFGDLWRERSNRQSHQLSRV